MRSKPVSIISRNLCPAVIMFTLPFASYSLQFPARTAFIQQNGHIVHEVWGRLWMD